MAKNRVIFVVIACFSMAVLATQTQSFLPRKLPPRKPGMTDKEYKKEFDRSIEEQRRQRREVKKEYMTLMARQAWQRLLRISEQQWMRIEQKQEKVRDLGFEANAGAGCGGDSEEKFHWNRPSESSYHLMEGKTRDQMPEGYRIVEELIDLLENENSKDEEIRKKIDALQQVREKARKELAALGRELAPLLTTARQEAVFLIMGYID